MATPIGNLGDITKRAVEALKQVDVIACEDTRTTGKLLTVLGIFGKKLISFYDNVEKEKTEQIVKILEQGIDVALVSEAGSPIISDPGFFIVKECKKRGIKVSVVPGPSAPVAALIASGIEPIPFTFLGFMPRKEGDIRGVLAPFSNLNTTLIFFERKSRLKASLKIANEVLKGQREVAIVKELTKRHEEVIHLFLSEFEKLGELKGEITVVISPPEKKELKTPMEDVVNIIKEEIEGGYKGRELVDRVVELCVGWNKKEVYNLYLRVKNG
ncbi:16S rRNA (cytidine(1402)-2'-O)-methyltransferase [Desulfothermus okinawensis JCM 13304]